MFWYARQQTLEMEADECGAVMCLVIVDQWQERSLDTLGPAAILTLFNQLEFAERLALWPESTSARGCLEIVLWEDHPPANVRVGHLLRSLPERAHMATQALAYFGRNCYHDVRGMMDRHEVNLDGAVKYLRPAREDG